MKECLLDLGKTRKLTNTRLDELIFVLVPTVLTEMAIFWKVPACKFYVSCFTLHWLSTVPKYLLRIIGYVQPGRSVYK